MVCASLEITDPKPRKFRTWTLLSLLGIGVSAIGCASGPDTIASITRYRASQAAGRARLPICSSASANDFASLADQDRYKVCMFVAKKKGIQFADSDKQRCLEPKLVWGVVATGAKIESESLGLGEDLESRFVYRHTLKLTLVDSDDETPVVEDRASTRSEQRALNIGTTYALCVAAFFGHPKPLENELVGVSYDK